MTCASRSPTASWKRSWRPQEARAAAISRSSCFAAGSGLRLNELRELKLSDLVLRHTGATNIRRAPHASLLELKRQGGWERWDMVERYSHATPPRDRSALPNPLQKSALHKSAFSQPPSSPQKRLSLLRTASG